MTRPRPHAAPPVRTGDRITIEPASRPPSLLVPWLATGLGLAALTALPDPSFTDVAGAQPAVTTGVQSPEVRGFVTTLNETAVLAAPTTSSTRSSSTAIDLEALATAERIDLQNAHGGEGAPTVVASMPLWADRTFAAAPTRRPEPTDAQWEALRACEASNDYDVTNASGKYRGAYQFDLDTWESVGGAGDPAAATSAEQDLRASLLYQRRGASPWPFCGRYLD